MATGVRHAFPSAYSPFKAAPVRMAEFKKKLMRIGGITAARIVRHVADSSKLIHEPPDLMKRLADLHPCIVACWHGQFMMVSTLRPENVKIAAMVARHGDAEIIGEALRAIDVELIRGAGAGHRKRDRGGAAALRASLLALNDGASLVMTAEPPSCAIANQVLLVAAALPPSTKNGNQDFPPPGQPAPARNFHVAPPSFDSSSLSASWSPLSRCWASFGSTTIE